MIKFQAKQLIFSWRQYAPARL